MLCTFQNSHNHFYITGSNENTLTLHSSCPVVCPSLCLCGSTKTGKMDG